MFRLFGRNYQSWFDGSSEPYGFCNDQTVVCLWLKHHLIFAGLVGKDAVKERLFLDYTNSLG